MTEFREVQKFTIIYNYKSFCIAPSYQENERR